jgi:hypothetical protein
MTDNPDWEDGYDDGEAMIDAHLEQQQRDKIDGPLKSYRDPEDLIGTAHVDELGPGESVTVAYEVTERGQETAKEWYERVFFAALTPGEQIVGRILMQNARDNENRADLVSECEKGFLFRDGVCTHLTCGRVAKYRSWTRTFYCECGGRTRL